MLVSRVDDETVGESGWYGNMLSSSDGEFRNIFWTNVIIKYYFLYVYNMFVHE